MTFAEPKRPIYNEQHLPQRAFLEDFKFEQGCCDYLVLLYKIFFDLPFIPCSSVEKSLFLIILMKASLSNVASLLKQNCNLIPMTKDFGASDHQGDSSPLQCNTVKKKCSAESRMQHPSLLWLDCLSMYRIMKKASSLWQPYDVLDRVYQDLSSYMEQSEQISIFATECDCLPPIRVCVRMASSVHWAYLNCEM